VGSGRRGNPPLTADWKRENKTIPAITSTMNSTLASVVVT
jgi:hypothetical protein